MSRLMEIEQIIAKKIHLKKVAIKIFLFKIKFRDNFHNFKIWLLNNSSTKFKHVFKKQTLRYFGQVLEYSQQSESV